MDYCDLKVRLIGEIFLSFEIVFTLCIEDVKFPTNSSTKPSTTVNIYYNFP